MIHEALVFVVVFLAPAAPAPFLKPERPGQYKPPVSCVMRWYGTDYDTQFFPNGTYVASHAGTSWYGWWAVAREKGKLVLKVSESTNPTATLDSMQHWYMAVHDITKDKIWLGCLQNENGSEHRLAEVVLTPK